MEISQRINGEVRIFEVCGTIDTYTSPEFFKTVMEQIEEGSRNIIFNFKQVTDIDSNGLGVMIKILKKIRDHEGSVKIIANNPVIQQKFNMTGLFKLFPMYETEEEALLAVE